ncbi:stemmadenine O-acetyltransferase-like [Trifolium pratense]|uniref:stemmadenine O-acetyltransferase-like n=1 Tax=Trifolium pratense TaxID=57577 RepID=UPI001E690CC1|nr:stemmadenine O-acetyltransferase-like [Trifolium pratense]
MEMVLLSRETIKPSSPTPSYLRIYPLSFIDNIFYRKYVPALFFYNTNDCSNQNFKISQLRKSLSQVLSKYYPFAGKLRDKTSIECNDQGVSFLVTKIQKKLSEILQNPTEKLLNPLFPDELQWKDMDWSGTLIVIQINCFACGGIAISICMTHKVGDGTTLFNFMNDWAIINQKVEQEEEGLLVLPVPILGEGASIFSQKDLPIFPELKLVKGNKMVCKTFVFQASMIKSLKTMLTNSRNSPTRVQVVTALIYKRAVSTMGLNFKTAPFSTVVDLRRRMVPPLSESYVGNIIWFSSTHIDKKEMELPDLVCKIKHGLYEFCDVYPKKFAGKEKDDLSFISGCLEHVNDSYSDDQTMFTFSSWCGFPIYEVDFGWGKPTWVTTFGSSLRNLIFMMDTRDGVGIEAYVNMEESDMARFENDVELLKYASLNPSNVEHDS